ncbi:hypothetical protein TNCV_1416251 [Trichonephila clavipes]|nr:hypothetical protein TNCV_1416251 [Trichonephila clavipes]
MASGHSLPQINLSVQGGTQGGSHKLSVPADIIRGWDLFIQLTSRKWIVGVELAFLSKEALLSNDGAAFCDKC